MCGSMSGAVAAAVTTPLDVIKTRLMLGAVSECVRRERESECVLGICVWGVCECVISGLVCEGGRWEAEVYVRCLRVCARGGSVYVSKSVVITFYVVQYCLVL